jgi:tripeptide aminopeptidase
VRIRLFALGDVEVAMTRSVALFSNSIAHLLVLWLISSVRAETTTSAIETAYQAILANPKVTKAFDDIKADDARTFEEQKRITEIPAPPFKEKARADYFLKRFQDLGFKDASMDAEGNVIRTRGHRIP